tara:strand:+ start:1306 stop:2073 length:768 start_codon:yes stop_codon:yes gene_type:complete
MDKDKMINEEIYIDPLIRANLWEELPRLEQVTLDSGRYYTKDDEKYYSVTTIIDAAKTVGSKNAIEAWKKAEIADGKDPSRYSREGEHMHSLIEYYYRNNYSYPPLEQCKGRGYTLFKQYDIGFLKNTHVIPHIIEGRLYTEVDGMKYAGTVDLVATIQTEPEGPKRLALIDHKSISKMGNASSKRKGYIAQLAAYAKAIKDKYGKTVDVCILNFASEKGFKSYEIEMPEVLEQWDQFYYKLESFYRKGVFPKSE